MTERSEDALKPCDSGMSGETVARAEMVWTNLPTRVPWTSLATHEKALVCHTVAALEAGCAGLVAENARQASLLKQALEAIDSRRSEPLFIMRDAIRNHLEDRTALRGDREQGEE
ncbi:hypothetical protein [Sphingomonas segetis]|uniref:hypothetical protein n=1 Tax=Sphingomonas segetis TaxID=1104779 RepID=UPI0012D34196|nr:hypothetical protein [Sphingomonas segetis]